MHRGHVKRTKSAMSGAYGAIPFQPPVYQHPSHDPERAADWLAEIRRLNPRNVPITIDIGVRAPCLQHLMMSTRCSYVHRYIRQLRDAGRLERISNTEHLPIEPN